MGLQPGPGRARHRGMVLGLQSPFLALSPSSSTNCSYCSVLEVRKPASRREHPGTAGSASAAPIPLLTMITVTPLGAGAGA